MSRPEFPRAVPGIRVASGRVGWFVSAAVVVAATATAVVVVVVAVVVPVVGTARRSEATKQAEAEEGGKEDKEVGHDHTLTTRAGLQTVQISAFRPFARAAAERL